MIGGVVVNVILAIVIFIGITWKWGEEYLPVQNLKYGIHADSLARSIGIQDGDKIVGINQKTIENFGTLESELMLNDAQSILVERNGATQELKIPEGFIKQLVKNRRTGG